MMFSHRFRRKFRRLWQQLAYAVPTWHEITRPFRRLRRKFRGSRHHHEPHQPVPDQKQIAETNSQRFFRHLRRRANRSWRAFAYWWPTWNDLASPFRRLRRHGVARRNFREFWAGIPAFVALLTWLGFAVLLLGWTPTKIELNYYLTASQAMSSRQYGKARVAFERLAQMDTKSHDAYVFGLALSLKGIGQEREAAALMTGLAPLDSAGFAPAHMLIARAILSNPDSDQNALNNAELHLKRILAEKPDDVDARLLLGQAFAKSGQWARAREQLLAGHAMREEAALTLAVIAAYQKDEKEFLRWAEQARKYFRAQVEARPAEPQLRLNWAEATLMLGEYAEALSILETGIMKTGDSAYRQMAARVYSEWSRNAAKTSPEDLGTRLSLIERGLEYAPNNEQLLMQLIALSRLTGKEADQARARLNRLLAQGGNTAILHLCLGIDAWQRKHLDEAREHFSLAYDIAPQMPFVANNMAMILALGGNAEPSRALAIIQSVVDKYPKDPHFRDTRGKILLKLGRWQEAVKELEYALPLLPSNSATHTALAEAYRHLGMIELAAEHERLAALDKGNDAPMQAKSD